ncbi:MAG: four helix bundle protein [Polyangiaceae bacterium]|nr:four helix bundle protein [Polyangiaceae bacterium]
MRPPSPLYVRCYDLTRWLLERTMRFPKSQRFVLGQRVERAALDLLEAITAALQEREGRAARLRRADEAATRLRVSLRLCRDLELLRETQATFAHGELTEIGKMLGGFRRSEREDLPHPGPDR